MTPEQQRIAIAESLGELNVRFTDSGLCIASIGEMEYGTFWGTHGIPDYLNDLNAMHESIKSLSVNELEVFAEELARITYGGGEWHGDFTTITVMEMLQSTAAQRAEAFLRTLNLWKP